MPANEGYSGPLWIEIDRIDPRPAIDMRTKEDAEAISDYAAEFDNLPPIRVVADAGDKHWTEDGSYRLRAARLLGRDRVQCLIKAGTFEDAFHGASRANGGVENERVRVTNADKQARVKVALSHPTMGKWSQHRIAEACAVTTPFVGMILHQHVNGLHAAVEGRNGQSYASTRPALTRKELAEKRELILAALKEGHAQPNTVIADRLEVDWRMVKKVREANGIPPSGAKGGGSFHKPKASKPEDPAEPTQHVPLPDQSSFLPPEAALSPADREIIGGLTEFRDSIEAAEAAAPPEPEPVVFRMPGPSTPVAERWLSVAASITGMFMSWPESDRPAFAFKLAAFSDTLFDLCPEIEDRSDQLLS